MSTATGAGSAAEFHATVGAARQARHDEGPADGTDRSWLTLADLLADDGAWVAATHARLVVDGDPPNAAAIYLAGWVGGLLGEAVGFVWAAAQAGVLADHGVRFRFHPDGWPDRVDLTGCATVVTSAHPWAGPPTGPGAAGDVQVVDDLEAVQRRTAHALVAALTPYLDRCRRLAKVGATSLWAEVADGIGGATSTSPELDDDGHTIAALQGLLAVPGMPWRRRPTMWCAAGTSSSMVVMQKGGCCLAYTATRPETPVPDATPGEPATPVDPEHAAYDARFPDVPGERRYCSSCRFRDRADVEARQVFWTELVLAKAARGSS